MARNLRNKIKDTDTMVIHDVNPAACENFAKEVGKVEIAKNVREVAEKTVCEVTLRSFCSTNFRGYKMNPFVLSMI